MRRYRKLVNQAIESRGYKCVPVAYGVAHVGKVTFGEIVQK